MQKLVAIIVSEERKEKALQQESLFLSKGLTDKGQINVAKSSYPA